MITIYTDIDMILGENLDSQRQTLPAGDGRLAAFTSFILTVNKIALTLPLDYASAAQRRPAESIISAEQCTRFANKSSGARKQDEFTIPQTRS